MLMVLPASVASFSIGRVSLVNYPLLSAALNTPPMISSATEANSGTDDAMVSTIIVNPPETRLTFSAALVVVTVNTC